MRFTAILIAISVGACGSCDEVRSAPAESPATASTDEPAASTDDPPRAPDLCGFGGWCWSHPTPMSADLRGVWADGDAVIAVGAAGTVLRLEGDVFHLDPTPTTDRLFAVSGLSASEALAVGERGTILQLHRGQWRSATSTTERALHDVWFRAADDAWAVGDAATVLHFDGSSWTAVETGARGQLRAVHGDGRRVVVAGDDGGALRVDGTWRAFDPHESGPDLIDAHVLADRVIVAGSFGSIYEVGEDGSSALLYRHDEDTRAAWPWLAEGQLRFATVGHRAIAEIDGEERTEVEVAPFGLSDMFGDASGPRWAVGRAGQIYRRRAGAWMRVGEGSTDDLLGVWGAAPDDVFAVGKHGRIVHHDGDRWTVMDSGVDRDLHAVWGRSGRDVFAVGQSGTIVHFDGEAWRVQDSGTTASLVDVMGQASGGDVWAVGGQTSVRYDGSRWSATAPTGDADVGDVLVLGAGEVYAASHTKLFRFDGEAWTPVPSEEGTRILPGMAYGPFLFNGHHAAFFFRGREGWVRVEPRPVYYPQGAWGDGAGRLVVGGLDGGIAHFDGLRWTEARSRAPDQVISAIWGHASGHLFAVGSSGMILHRDGLPDVLPRPVDAEPEHRERQRERTRRLREARASAAAGRWLEALTALEPALESFEDDPVLLCEAGWAAYHAGRLDDAERHLRRGARSSRRPESRAACHYNLGRVLEQRGETERAAEQYRLSLSHRANATVTQRLADLGVPEAAHDDVIVHCAPVTRFASVEALCTELLDRIEREDRVFGGVEGGREALDCRDPSVLDRTLTGGQRLVGAELLASRSERVLAVLIRDDGGWGLVGWIGTNEQPSFTYSAGVGVVDVSELQLIDGGPTEIRIELALTEADYSAATDAMWECDEADLAIDDARCVALMEAAEDEVFAETTPAQLVCALDGGRWACARMPVVPGSEALATLLRCAD